MSNREASLLEPFADSAQPVAHTGHHQTHQGTHHESEPVPEPAPEQAVTAAVDAEAATDAVAATDAEASALSRETKMAKTRAAKMEALFKDKHYRILGEIHLEPDEQFQTPFGNRGRHGYVLKAEDTGKKIMVGETILRKAAALYGGIEGLPPEKPKRSRRTKAQKAAEDAQKAAIAAENQERILARFAEQHGITV